ncbi:nucleotidyltransferase family protein [Actinomadura sp. NPDC049753]|uniref:nucleotidyltransferase family protein n=1 Tax=Actinomadura sp. NPDC049753 TaxID=3154739 RepID=UPI00343BC4B9
MLDNKSVLVITARWAGFRRDNLMDPAEIVDIALRDPWRAAVLAQVREHRLKDCWVAGVVRNIVWDHLHGYAEPNPLNDIDVTYFNAGNIDRNREPAAQRKACTNISRLEVLDKEPGADLCPRRDAAMAGDIHDHQDIILRRPRTQCSVRGVRPGRRPCRAADSPGHARSGETTSGPEGLAGRPRLRVESSL